MPSRLQAAASRLILLVMLFTFLSPNLGWQMTASHDQIEHALTGHLPEHEQEDHHGAHGFIGHLLTHMPASITGTFTVPAPVVRTSGLPVRQFSFSPGTFEAPFRPPRAFPFA